MVQVYVFFLFPVPHLQFVVQSWDLFQEGLDTIISQKAFQLKRYLYHIKKSDTNR